MQGRKAGLTPGLEPLAPAGLSSRNFWEEKYPEPRIWLPCNQGRTAPDSPGHSQAGAQEIMQTRAVSRAQCSSRRAPSGAVLFNGALLRFRRTMSPMV